MITLIKDIEQVAMGTNKRGRKFKEVMVLFLSENIGDTHVAFFFYWLYTGYQTRVCYIRKRFFILYGTVETTQNWSQKTWF